MSHDSLSGQDVNLTWTIINDNDEVVAVRVDAFVAEDLSFSGTGSARHDPSDLLDGDLGVTLAMSRALLNLGRKMRRQAFDWIEANEIELEIRREASISQAIANSQTRAIKNMRAAAIRQELGETHVTVNGIFHPSVVEEIEPITYTDSTEEGSETTNVVAMRGNSEARDETLH